MFFIKLLGFMLSIFLFQMLLVFTFT